MRIAPQVSFASLVFLLQVVAPQVSTAEGFTKATLSGEFPTNNRKVFSTREVSESSRILYTTTTPSGTALELVSALTDGSGAVLLDNAFARPYSGGLENLVVSPNGQWIGYRNGLSGELVVQRVDGSVRQILEIDGQEGSGVHGFTARTSAVIATFRNPGPGNISIWRFRMDGLEEPFHLYGGGVGTDAVVSVSVVPPERVVIHQFAADGSRTVSRVISTDAAGGQEELIVHATLPRSFNRSIVGPTGMFLFDTFGGYRVEYEGEPGTNMTSLPGVGTIPVVSPSGEKIFYHISDRDIIVSEPGGVVRQIPHTAPTLADPQFSPDETRVVGWSGYPGGTLWSIDLENEVSTFINSFEGTLIRQVPSRVSQSGGVRISPDGQSVVFAGFDNSASEIVGELFVTPIDGGPFEQLDSGPQGFQSAAAFEILRDGSAVVSITEELRDQPSHLVLTPIDGSSTVALTENFVEGGDVDSVMVLSDGSGVIFEADAETNSVNELFFLPTPLVAGVTPTKVSRPELGGEAGSILKFETSPDGNWVAYTAAQDLPGVGELFVASIDGTVLNKVNPSFTALADINRFAFSHDSKRIFYSADQDVNRIRDFYVANIDGTGLRKLSEGIGEGFEVDRFAESPDGTVVAARVVNNVDDSDDELGQIWLFDADGDVPAARLPHPGYVASDQNLDFSPDSRFLSFGASREEGLPRVMALVDMMEAERTVQYFDNWFVSRRAFTPDSRRLLFSEYVPTTGTFGGLLGIDLENFTLETVWEGNEGFNGSFGISPGGRWLIAMSIERLPANETRFKLTLVDLGGQIDPVTRIDLFGGRFSQDGEKIITTNADGRLVVFTIDEFLDPESEPILITAPAGSLIDLSPDCKTVFAANSGGGILQVAEVAPDPSFETLAENLPNRRFFFSADSNTLISNALAHPKGVGQVNLADGEVTESLTIFEHGYVFELRESNSGHLVYTGQEQSLAQQELFSIQFESDVVQTFEDWSAGLGLASPLEDPDCDGLANVFEFLFGTAPGTSDLDTAQQRAGVRTIAGESFPTFEFSRQISAGLETTVEQSSDLGDWIPVASNIGSGQRILPVLGRSVVVESGGEVYVRGTTPLEESPRQQFRIRVSIPAS